MTSIQLYLLYDPIQRQNLAVKIIIERQCPRAHNQQIKIHDLFLDEGHKVGAASHQNPHSSWK
jgi:hypothetical protein